MPAITPLIYGLVIKVYVRLGQETHEAILYPQLNSRRLSILRSARAPKVEHRTLLMEFANSSYDGRHGDTLGSERADQGVIYIDEYDALLHVMPMA